MTSTNDTGYWIMISTLMSVLTPILLKYIDTWANSIIKIISNYQYIKPISYKGSVQLSCITTVSSHGESTNDNMAYKSVMYHLMSKSLLSNVKQNAQRPPWNEDYSSISIKKQLNLVINEKSQILIDVDTQTYVIISQNSALVDNTTFNSDIITLASSKLNVSEILDLIANYQIAYNNYIKRYINTNILKYIKLKSFTHDSTQGNTSRMRTPCWLSRDFHTNKSFDNIFFENKELILKQISNFMTGEEIYAKRGIPYTLCILLHGEPGCGKTSFIKALAKHLNRNLIDINLGAIESCNDFIQLFNTEIIDSNYIPANKAMVILEDLDCMSTILKPRQDKDIQTKKETGISEELPMEKFIYIQDPMNLSCFLNTLDGIQELHNRVIVATTNHIDQLDSAVLRRFTINIEFKMPNPQIYQQIIDNYFGFHVDDIPYAIMSCSKLIHTCTKSGDDPDVLRTLIRAGTRCPL